VSVVAADSEVDAQLARLGPRALAVAVLTYNNAATIEGVAAAVHAAVEARPNGMAGAIINVDVGSSDGTPETLAGAGSPVLAARVLAPMTERAQVPFHGVPGRAEALRAALTLARRLEARVLVLVEADLVSLTPEWIERLARPVWEAKADFVAPAYARHRYDGTVTNLLLRPLVRALYGRRLRQPLGGQQALSARLVEHLLVHPQWTWSGREVVDLWIVGTAIADGFAVWETWLGRPRVESRTRSTDLPAMIAQTLGAVFALMGRHQDLWREVRGSEPVPAFGEVVLPGTEPMTIDVERLLAGFRLGMRDLVSIWEHILTADTLGDVLGLDTENAARFRFPDDLWARVIYDFALGHHYAVVHREHLLRSLVPLYLGRTAAFVAGTRALGAEATEVAIDAVGAAFERQKPYLTERWR
jgi:glycosyltransferase involved in cell wall biosynthesis